MTKLKPIKRRKPAAERQSKSFVIRLTIKEHKQLAAEARAAGLSASAYIRRLLRTEPVRL